MSYQTSNQLRHWRGLRRLRFLVRGAYKLAVRGNGIKPEEKECLLREAEEIGEELQCLIKNCYLLPAMSVFYGAVARLYHLIGTADVARGRDQDAEEVKLHQGIDQEQVDQLNFGKNFITDHTAGLESAKEVSRLEKMMSEESEKLENWKPKQEEVKQKVLPDSTSSSTATIQCKNIPPVLSSKTLEFAKILVQKKTNLPHQAELKPEELKINSLAQKHKSTQALKRKFIKPTFIQLVDEFMVISKPKKLPSQNNVIQKSIEISSPLMKEEPMVIPKETAIPSVSNTATMLKKRPPIKPWPRSKLDELRRIKNLIKYY
jgi:hypothetical protein